METQETVVSPDQIDVSLSKKVTFFLKLIIESILRTFKFHFLFKINYLIGYSKILILGILWFTFTIILIVKDEKVNNTRPTFVLDFEKKCNLFKFIDRLQLEILNILIS